MSSASLREALICFLDARRLSTLLIDMMPNPRSFLFVTLEGGGNVPPVLGLARRLAARGHDVRVLS